MIQLDGRESRTDLTDRELVRIIGGLLGSLAGVASDVETLRRAVRWWAETDDVWSKMKIQQDHLEASGMSPRRR
jgi:hypothetical protein